jgi:hypothetical protein
MAQNKEILSQSLSLAGIANASIAYASFGMTTEDDRELWNSVRKGTA